MRVHAVVGDFEHHLGDLPGGGTRLVAFLGSTIGNLAPEPRARFLADLAASLAPGDALLLGTDLVKDVDRLARRVRRRRRRDRARSTATCCRCSTASSTPTSTLSSSTTSPVWNPDEEWIEMRLRSQREQTVHLRGLGLTIEFAAGEELRTEISAKFRRERVEQELAAAGFHLAEWWTDAADDFALSLSFVR